MEGLRELNLQTTGQFKKKVTLSHVYNEVTSEPAITLRLIFIAKSAST
jgi:hypothetical protein